jgi:hypothetical protein
MTAKNITDRIARAIAKNRVPLSLADRFWFWLNPGLVLGLGSYLFYRNEIADRASTFGAGWSFIDAPGFHAFLLILAGIGGFMIFKNLRLFRLTPVADLRPVAEKKKIAADLGKENGWQLAEQDAGIIRFYAPRAGGRSPHVVTILYDESGFYLSCLDAGKKTLDWGSGKKIVSQVEKLLTGTS